MRAAGKLSMYVDSSIIVKLLVPEADTEYWERTLTGLPLFSSELAWTEVASALFAKERNEQIETHHREIAWRVFARWVESEQIRLITLNSLVLSAANGVLQACHPAVPLPALDAIHISTCDSSQQFPMCTSDRRMRDAAKLLRLPIFPGNV